MALARTHAVVVALLFCLSGCLNSRGGPIPYEPTAFGAPDTALPTYSVERQQLSPLDTIGVSVFQVEELSGTYQIDVLGNVVLPLIGSVPARGKTADELAADLQKRYGERYLSNPRVQVVAKTTNPETITVDGAVGKPGVFPVQTSLTLLQAIALSGGPTDDANPRRVFVFRKIDGKRAAAAFDLTAIRRNEMADPRVYGNDIIVVDGSAVGGSFKQALRTLPLISVFRFL